MRLKSLEIRGFKSFAEKTTLHFGEDVIGIVGSNGCGKSNIVDAIRWVLGEQKSKQLRSDNMMSVIFNGTKKRKAAGLAEVTLTFENTKNILPTEFQEVAISRTLYRSGDSEYRINDVKCRLKDIRNMLVDTGMGSNSYAIIALGMVDDLLNDKENARRRMFEQAAGISKYKMRKRETLRKLKSTTENLERAEDLLFEIEKNLKSLEKQAKRAKRFFELKERYKELSIELAVFKLSSYKEDYKKIEGQLEAEQERLVQIEAQSKKLEAELEQEKAAHIEKEQQLSGRQKALNKLVGEIRNAENEQKVLSQKGLFVQQNADKLKARIQLNAEKLERLELETQSHEQKLRTEQQQLELLDKEMQSAKAVMDNVKLDHGNLKSELEAFVKDQKEYEQRIFQLEKQLAVRQNQQENIEQDQQRYRRQLQERREQNQKLQAEMKAQKAKQEAAEQELAQLEKAEEERESSLESTEQSLQEAREALQQLQRRYDAKKNEYQLTKSLVENMEGFPESIKFLSKQSDWGKSVPLLSDLFYCPPEYRSAIENLLEPYLNYYVLQSTEEALQAVDLLAQAKKGKANFFLLQDLQGKSSEAPSHLPEGAIAALDIVQFDAAYQALAEQLLASVYLLPDAANWKELPNSHTWISTSGRLIRRSHSLRGGSVGAFEGKKIGRKKNLERLEQELSQMKEELQKYQIQTDTFRKRQQELKNQQNKGRIRDLQNQLNRLVREGSSLQARLESFDNYEKEHQEREQRLQQKKQELEKANKTDQQQLQHWGAEMRQLKEEMEETDATYKDISESLSDASAQYNQVNIEFIRQQNRVEGLQRELNYAQKQQRDLQQQRSADQKALEQADEERRSVEEQMEELKNNLQNWYQEKRELQQALSGAEKAYYASRGHINDLENELRQVNHKRQQSNDLLRQLEQRFNELKLQLTSMGERLSVEFEVNINQLIHRDPDPEWTQDKLQAKVDKLRDKIQNYGTINPMAVEAYEEMKERYDFMTEQRNDLLEAQESLEKTIQEIEEKATSRFMDAFNQVREHFIKVFRSLFQDDDTCDLLLVDPDDPLESPINIVAKPKGKRPQSINQLSGGEKTLTATALLFALYLLKPAPFCIFDEVDAPLDDANIAKFNNIIKEFSASSQFVIVTHNKKTMAAVDILYGVTMVQGVSQVVPVDFRALEAV